MKSYDVIVIGSGCGMSIVEEALDRHLKVALVDKGPYGGTCLNLGCIPSKMLISPADRVTEIQESWKLGIDAEVREINFQAIMERMRKSISDAQKEMKQGLSEANELDFYEGEGHFIADYTLEVGGEQIKGKQIFIATGSRPLIPPIKGLDEIEYLTNETVLQLNERPESLVIIGGGYIAVEFGHFFAAMGTRVTIVEMADRLVLSEEPEIAALLKTELSKRMEVRTGTTVEEVRANGNQIVVLAKENSSGKERRLSAEKTLIAVGRKSNADLLKPEKTGVELDGKEYIKVDEYLQTTKKNIFAIGDANGQQMFTHVANREAEIAAQNAFGEEKQKMDYRAAPHAVYSYPKIASVGLTQAQAGKDHQILVGMGEYMGVAQGEAMMEKDSFAKIIIDKENLELLGFHIIGSNAPILIQEVINAMTSGGHIHEIIEGLHIHPALTELIPSTIRNLEEPTDHQDSSHVHS
ncbi:MAG: dihydrolipoyl dehydrogenase [Dehalococcoidia bacterium]|nr:dihydrolipoyl dehydrogenase [Dehalococcoidia bacterium]